MAYHNNKLIKVLAVFRAEDGGANDAGIGHHGLIDVSMLDRVGIARLCEIVCAASYATGVPDSLECCFMVDGGSEWIETDEDMVLNSESYHDHWKDDNKEF